MKKVSVIVAVYGVEYWIEESLSSLLNQSLAPEQMEIILVNDASPDDSMILARRLVETRFRERLPYVKFIDHPFNMGVSHTRRDGILAATGDYIIHFDPDDLLHPRAYEIMLAEAERTDADVTLCDFLFDNGKRKTHLAQRPNEMTARCLMEQICGAQLPSRHGSMCNKLIRSSLYEQVKLPDRINFCEDAMTVCSMLCLPGIKIASTDLPLYTYRYRPGSMVGTTNYEGDIRLYKELGRRAGEVKEVWQRDAFSAFISSLLY
ncbi:MAG: glycosyltransferase, partial [Muribaculaceae bacterium]|nr:glycosyltransferase [Muribaculaceae bacterium]